MPEALGSKINTRQIALLSLPLFCHPPTPTRQTHIMDTPTTSTGYSMVDMSAVQTHLRYEDRVRFASHHAVQIVTLALRNSRAKRDLSILSDCKRLSIETGKLSILTSVEDYGRLKSLLNTIYDKVSRRLGAPPFRENYALAEGRDLLRISLDASSRKPPTITR